MIKKIRNFFLSLSSPKKERPKAEECSLYVHYFKEVSWDEKKYGPQTKNFDPDHGTALEFPMCDYQTLLRCKCGKAKFIKTQTSLI